MFQCYYSRVKPHIGGLLIHVVDCEWPDRSLWIRGCDVYYSACSGPDWSKHSRRPMARGNNVANKEC